MSAYRTSFVLLAVLLVLVTLAALASDQNHRDEPGVLAGGSSDIVSSRVPLIGAGKSRSPSTAEPAGTQDQHPLDPVLEFAREVLTHMQTNVADYEALLVKRERIGGKLGTEFRMELKVRNPLQAGGKRKGLAAYMKFTEPRSSRGREVIWVEDQNDNKLIAHEGGFKNLLRLNLAPDGSLAMLGNKYPITEIGLIRLVEKLIEKGERDRALGPCSVEVIENQMVGDRSCRLIQVVHPRKRDGFDFHIAQIFVDVERMIPLRYAAFLWPKNEGDPPPLEEEYSYLNVQLNVGLTDADFDPDNSQYQFP